VGGFWRLDVVGDERFCGGGIVIDGGRGGWGGVGRVHDFGTSAEGVESR